MKYFTYFTLYIYMYNFGRHSVNKYRCMLLSFYSKVGHECKIRLYEVCEGYIVMEIIQKKSHKSFNVYVSTSYYVNIQCAHKIQQLQIYLYILLVVLFGLYKYICNRRSLSNIKTEARWESG